MRRAHDCQYDDSARKSRTQTLREKLMALEAKLRELEYQPGSSKHPTAIHLHDHSSSSSSQSPTPPPLHPFDTLGAPQQQQFNLDPSLFGHWLDNSSTWDINEAESSMFSTMSLPASYAFAPDFVSASALTPLTSSPSQLDPPAFTPRQSEKFYDQSSGTFNYMGAAFVESTPDRTWVEEQHATLPHQTRIALIHSFIHHKDQCCFYTDVSRLQPHLSTAGIPSASPSLAAAVVLLGCFFSPKGSWTSAIEQQLLQDALHEASTSLHDQDQLTDVVQALTLLAQYFFFNDRNMEGHRHLMAVKRIATELGLQKVTHPDLALFPFNVENPFAAGSRPPAVMMEGAMGVSGQGNLQGVQSDWWEQSLVFWQIFLVDCLWAAGNEFVSPDFDGACRNVTTPLPVLDHDLQATVKNSPLPSLFAVNSDGFQASSLSTTAFKVMASCIFDRSLRLYGMPSQDPASWSYHNSLELALQRLVKTIPEFNGKNGLGRESPGFDAELYAVHVIILTSTIQLHVDNVMNLKISLAAKNLVELINQLGDDDYVYLDPALTVCWASVVKSFRRMINHLDSRMTATSAPSNAMYSAVFLRRCIDVVLGAMQKMRMCKPLAKRLLKELKDVSPTPSMFPYLDVGPHGYTFPLLF
ncbi:hypothetical protein CPB83DRAFT_845658 [Crepidotus variabilis]|uniref:Xylanolytic transcriptional activator regulatory domain-containing protein n=1 Tax=Crepidotus variabilis TaxID=179855 RepID=A0A9P6JVQ2_9AGAR|nr:hypothetical protein CPB83DRAFT_845658 [Crepidotus variabilis]